MVFALHWMRNSTTVGCDPRARPSNAPRAWPAGNDGERPSRTSRATPASFAHITHRDDGTASVIARSPLLPAHRPSVTSCTGLLARLGGPSGRVPGCGLATAPRGPAADRAEVWPGWPLGRGLPPDRAQPRNRREEPKVQWRLTWLQAALQRGDHCNPDAPSTFSRRHAVACNGACNRLTFGSC